MTRRERPGEGRVLVVVPTYNERPGIAELTRRLFEAVDERVELLVVDDSSPDGTAELVKEIAAGSSRVHLIERPEKAGLGSAYVEAFWWALARGHAAVVEMDADLSHDPADVPRLLDALAGADLVIGSRYVNGGNTANWGLLRRALSRAANAYATTWLRLGVKDATSGFRAYRAETLAAHDLSTISSEGYAFQIEMTLRVARGGGRIEEVPITFVERASGRSKLSSGTVVEAAVKVARWGLRARLPVALRGARRTRPP